MSKISMTVRQIKDLELWDKVCEYKNINPWSINEGLINYDDMIEFDTEFKEDRLKEYFKNKQGELEETQISLTYLMDNIYDNEVSGKEILENLKTINCKIDRFLNKLLSNFDEE